MKALVEASVEDVEDSTTSTEASMATMEAFMEAIEASMGAGKLPVKQWKLLWNCGSFHGSFHAFMPCTL